ncbi:MAG: SRPBCC domain-containing protein [Caulobacteraceae bacterium]
MTSRVMVALRVAASPERAFEAFTRETAAWWSPNAMFRFTPRDPGVLSFEPGEGGRLVETLPSGKVFEIGKVSVWSPPSRLVFGWRQASFEPGQATEVEVRFEPVGEETRITVEHSGWDSVPAAHVARHGFPNAIFLQRHAEWWRTLLEALKVRIAGGDRGGQ